MLRKRKYIISSNAFVNDFYFDVYESADGDDIHAQRKNWESDVGDDTFADIHHYCF